MNRFALFSLLFLASLSPVVPLADAADDRPDVLVVADAVTTEGQLRPSPDKPIYYAIIGKAENDIGYPYAGGRNPDRETLHQELVKSLAAQGYIEARLGGPRPQIALFISWGQANLDGDQLVETLDSVDADTGEATNETFSRPINQNTREMVLLTGAYKVDWFARNSPELDMVKDAIRHDRLYVMVAALDAAALAKKEKQLLWRTRISIDARGWNLRNTLAPMLADAAPFFGRNETRPVVVNEQLRRTKVVLGELKFLGSETPPPPKTESK